MMNVSAGTHVGKRRTNNEDFFLVTDQVVVVADGIGGNTRGEEASRTACEEFVEFITIRANDVPDDFTARRFLSQAVAFTHNRVRALDSDDGRPGTTLVAMVEFKFNPSVRYVVNVGDSRCYGEDGQITVDHCDPVFANQLTRCIGVMDEEPEADIYVVGVEPGDRLVICTDGFYKEFEKLDDSFEIEDAQEFIDWMVDQESTWCSDNLTAVFVEIA